MIEEIYTRFSQAREKDRVSAWMGLQRDLSTHASQLIPVATSLKDMNSTLADIELMLKGQQGDAGQSPTEYLEEFLQGKSETTQ